MSPYTFTQHVSAVVVGDDNDFCNDGSVEFGHVDMAKQLEEAGLGFSMPNKSDAPVNYFPLSTADFLKRGFSMIDGNVVGPLSLDSVFKSLTTITESKIVSEIEQLGQTISNVNRELVLHGRDVYARFHCILEEVLDEYPPIVPFVHWRFYDTYENLFEWVLQGAYNDSMMEEDLEFFPVCKRL
jgi:hypothetical protein